MPTSLRVAVPLLDGMWTHDLANVIQVFGNGTPLHGQVPCDLAFVSSGTTVALDHGLFASTMPQSDYVGRPQLVCIPGFIDPLVWLDETSLPEAAADAVRSCYQWVRDMHDAGAELAALGTGTFVLAGAGLLSGVRCTTHHAFADSFSELFPDALLERDHILTHEAGAGIWTSAGGASGLDLCVSLLSHLAGPSAAIEVTRDMSLWRPHEMGARSDAFGIPLPARTEREGIGADGDGMDVVCDAMLADLARRWRVSELASLAGMSVRTFERHFLRATGETPRGWLAAQRLSLARLLLEQTDLPLSLVASRVGFSGADVLYRAFVEVQGESPSAYRKRLAARPAT